MNELYYRHSGKWSLGAALPALAVGALAAVVLAAVYAYAALYVPVVGTITVILTAGFGAAAGAIPGTMLKRGNTRSKAVAAIIGVVVGLIALWASWVFWIYALLRRSDVDVSLPAIAFAPTSLWSAMVEVNKRGVWNVHGLQPSGAFLWVIWGLEACIIFFLSYALCEGTIAAQPFCESCNRWCEAEEDVGSCAAPANAGAGKAENAAELRTRLEAKDFSALEKQGPVGNRAEWLRWDLHVCKSCGGTNTLALKAVKAEVEKKGQVKLHSVELFHGLIVSQAEVEQLRGVGQKLRLSPATAAA